MTDKEIIINVDRCKYRDKYTNFCLAEKDDIGETYTICTGTDCYYKQSKRKEQECENLNKRVSSLEEIADDLQQRNHHLTQECENLKAEEKYLKQCCQKAGEELAKHSFEYDGKEKNLVVQAIELNEKYEKLKEDRYNLNMEMYMLDRYRKALEEIEEHYEKVVKNLTTYDDSYDANISIEALHNISSIINKAKGETNA